MNTPTQLGRPSPHSSPNFKATTLLQRQVSSTPNRHNHFLIVGVLLLIVQQRVFIYIVLNVFKGGRVLINKIIECLSNRHVGLRWSFLLLSSLSFFSSFSFFLTSTVHSATEHPKIFSLIFFKFPNLSYINNFFFFF